MKRKCTLAMVLLLAMAAGGTRVLSSQDEESPEQREAEARQAAAAQAVRERAEEMDNARKVWLDQSDQQSAARLEQAAGKLTEAKAHENETRFDSMRTSAARLLALSQKIQRDVQVNGAQTVSVSLFKDLDDIDKTVKALRKSAK